MRARLQAHVQRGALRSRPRAIQRVHLRVGAAEPAVPSFGDDAAAAHEERAHHGIGFDFAESAAGQFEAPAHEFLVGAAAGHASRPKSVSAVEDVMSTWTNRLRRSRSASKWTI